MRVLLIEDNPGDVQILRAALERTGKGRFELETAGTLAGGLKLLAEKHFDVLLLDLGLPDSFGVDTLIAVRKKDDRIPVVIFTVSEDEDTALKALKNGAQDYIVKSEITGNVVVRSIKYAAERKRGDDVAHQALAAEQGMLRQILGYAPVGMVRLDGDSKIVDVNQAMTELLDLSEDQIVGKNLFEDFPMLPAEQLRAAVEEGRPLRLIGHQMGADKPGQEIMYWDLAQWPIRGPEDRISGSLLVVEDVSDRVRLAQQREDMMATLAHDLKTPLLGVDRALGLLLDGVLGELQDSQAEVVAMVRKSNTDFLNRIRTLLEVFAFDTAHPRLEPEEIDMTELVSECLADLKPIADHHSISFVPGSDPDCYVFADRKAIKRLLINLLDNAAKFSPPESKVEIVTSRQGRETVVEVRDFGMGIPEEDIPKLFQRFWQGEPGKRYPTGTGLGLYLCKKIAEAHQGKISCRSKLEEGTTFSVTMPCAGRENSEGPGPAEHS